jgi:hypothetical protein
VRLFLLTLFDAQVANLRQSFEFDEKFPFGGPEEETPFSSSLPWAPISPQAASQFNPDDYQPLPSQMAFIWQTYCENVDHAVKILHRGSIEKVIRDCKGKHRHHLPPSLRRMLTQQAASPP